MIFTENTAELRGGLAVLLGVRIAVTLGKPNDDGFQLHTAGAVGVALSDIQPGTGRPSCSNCTFPDSTTATTTLIPA